MTKDVFGDYSIIAVPPAERRSLLAMFVQWTSVVTTIAAVWGGGAIGKAGDFLTVIAAIIIGSLVLAILGGLTSLIGGYTHMTTYAIMRYPFGRLGSSLVGLICTGIGACAWFAFQTWLFSILINTMFPGYWFSSMVVASIWGGILMMLTALYGIAAIISLSYLLTPFFILLVVVGTAIALGGYGGLPALLAVKPAEPLPLGTLITIVVGYYAVGAVIAADLARFSTKPRDGAIAWALQVTLFNTFFLFAGAASVMLTGSPDIATAMMKMGLGISALALFALTQFDTNDDNLWVSSLAWVNGIGRLSRRAWTTIMGIVGTIWATLISAGYGQSMEVLLRFGEVLGILIPPIGIILIVDFFVFRPFILGLKDPTARLTFGPGTTYSKVNLAGMISWIIASLLAFLLSPVAPPIVIGSVVAAIAYLILAIGCHKAGVKYELGKWIEGPSGF